MNDDTDVPPRSSRQNPAYRPTSDTPALHSQRIQSDARQIHTRSVAPYLARCAQYGLCCALLLRNTGRRLRLCAHYVARIRLRYRPISRVALNTGSVAPYCYAIRDAGSGYVLTTLRAYAYAIALSRALRSIRALCHPGVALRLPRAVFWRPFRALHFPLAIFVTSAAGRCPFLPRHICHFCRRQMSIPPRHICHFCRRQMSTPPRHLWRGVADRPGVRSDGQSVADRPGVRSDGQSVADRPGVRSGGQGGDVKRLGNVECSCPIRTKQ